MVGCGTGTQFCKHGKKKTICKDPSCGGGGGLCEHKLERNACRYCNPNHPFYGLETNRKNPFGKTSRSKFELKYAIAISENLPEHIECDTNVQLITPTINLFADFVLYNKSDKSVLGVIETDGGMHYGLGEERYEYGTTKGIINDRKKDYHVVTQMNASLVRIPHAAGIGGNAVHHWTKYAITAIQQDAARKTPRVHFVAYAKSYAQIDVYNHIDPRCTALEAIPGDVDPTVYVRTDFTNAWAEIEQAEYTLSMPRVDNAENATSSNENMDQKEEEPPQEQEPVPDAMQRMFWFAQPDMGWP